MKTVITILSFALLSTTMSGCSKEATEEMFSTSGLKADALTVSELIGSWKFKGYSDNKKVPYEVTLEFKNERGDNALPQLSGRSAVNFYTASYEPNAEKKTIKISVLGSTKMAGPPEAMEFELVYYTRLAKMMSYDFKDKNTLVIYLSDPAKEVMYFERN